MLNNVLELMPDNDKNNVVILSGGLDSTILTHLLCYKYGAENVIALTFNYNQRHSIEIEKSKLTCENLNVVHHILNIDFLGELVKNVSCLSKNSELDTPNITDVLGDPQPITYIPYRNMLFITMALSFAESNNANNVFIGAQSCDLYGYWDTTPQFIERMNSVSQLNRKNEICIRAPFVDLLKKDEIQIGQKLNVDFTLTHTCYNPQAGMLSCGKCASCSERIKNFMDVGIKDPIDYAIGIDWDTKCVE